MRSAFSRQHFTIKDLKSGLVIPDVLTVGNLMAGHETEKIRTATPKAQGKTDSNATQDMTGLGRYVNISGNSDPDDPYFEFILSDATLALLDTYQKWEVECRKNASAGSSRSFEITYYRNENLDSSVAKVLIYNARCKKFGPQGDSTANSGGDKHQTYRVELECEQIIHAKKTT